ncbi:hypothetical protein ATO11_04375 [Pseudaestuariivita atlantica]|uniref:TIR domain-containing protein n=1 Tax=Pseudaestuariivita atlantica TaxID=1317121 RepID=A0A0L1JS75_9RHOB|nr:hypothetical protein ATO11_04375 [Pseudaestuariivita atlantica]
MIDYMRTRGASVWYDGDVVVGNFEDQIMEAIDACKAFVAFITEASVAAGSTGWVEREISYARDSRKPYIYPCIIGDFQLPQSLDRSISSLQQGALEEGSNYLENEAFKKQIDFLIDVACQGASESSRPVPVGATPAEWFTHERSVKAEALALTVACLEYAHASAVLTVAKSLEAAFEVKLRPLTEEEAKAQPRSISAATQSAMLSEVAAERVSLPDPWTGKNENVVRFKDRNWRHGLLSHVWLELDEVREVFLAWISNLLIQKDTAEFGLYISRTLGTFALLDFRGLEINVLDHWLDPERGLDLHHVRACATIMAVAAEDKSNTPQIEAQLIRLLSSRRNRLAARQAALIIALGPLGLRRPKIAMEVLRRLDRQTFANDALLEVFLRTDAIYGAKKDDERDIDVSEMQEAVASEEASESAGGVQETLETMEDRLEPVAVSALPAAEFLAELADWADAKVDGKPGLIKRQTPLAALFFAMQRMPLLTSKRSNRLTLEDLTSDIADKWPGLIDRLIRAFVRAALARPLNESRYVPKRHMQEAMRLFARERDMIRKNGGALPDRDPYLWFAAKLYAAFLPYGDDTAALVLERSSAYLLDKDIAAIRSGLPL